LAALVSQNKRPPPPRLRLLAIWGVLLASFGLAVLAIWPGLDLAASALFFTPPHSFIGTAPLTRHLRSLVAILPFIAYGAAVLAYFGGVAGWLGPCFRVRLRSFIFLTATLALGPGLLVNEGFKAHMHRSRPVHVRDFGGEAPFQPYYQPDGGCAKNCSFPSGETAAAFWMLAPAALAPPPLRAGAVTLTFLLGLSAGALRIAAGAHFLSDALFSGWLMGLLIIGFWNVARIGCPPPPAAKTGLQADRASL